MQTTSVWRSIQKAATTTSLVLICAAGLTRTAEAQGNAVTRWNAHTSDILRAANIPIAESRAFAMVHAAIHDALNAMDYRFDPYTPGLPLTPGASVDATVASAAFVVLSAVVPGVASITNQRYAQELAAIQNDPSKMIGIELGRRAGELILERRRNDGSEIAGPPRPSNPANPNDPYVPTGKPGDYQFTPPFDFALYPSWGLVRPFGIKLSQHPLRGPAKLDSFEYALDFNYTKAVGAADSKLRTREQSQIGEFWFEDSTFAWNRLASAMITMKNLDAWRSARVLAWLNFAMADGYIAGWEGKYRFRFWRPWTAIEKAASDGNPLTIPDAGWRPFFNSPPAFFTPPLPDYPSTHTVLGAASAEVLIHAFGDNLRFTATSTSLPGVQRTFRNFSEAALENGLSRVYGGIHFLRAVLDGYHLGQSIGRTETNLLAPRRR